MLLNGETLLFLSSCHLLGVELRNQYIKYRLLSSEEEMIAGKFSNVGLRLDTVRKTLQGESFTSITSDAGDSIDPMC